MASSSTNWQERLNLKYVIDPKYVFKIPDYKDNVEYRTCAWGRSVRYPIDVHQWTWYHVLSIVCPAACMDVKCLYGLLFRYQVCRYADLDPTTVESVKEHVPKEFLQSLSVYATQASVQDALRFLDYLPTDVEYNAMVMREVAGEEGETELNEFIPRKIHHPRSHQGAVFPVDVADEMVPAYAFHVYAHEYNIRKETVPVPGPPGAPRNYKACYVASKNELDSFPMSIAPRPVTVDGRSLNPEQYMVEFLNRLSEYRLGLDSGTGLTSNGAGSGGASSASSGGGVGGSCGVSVGSAADDKKKDDKVCERKVVFTPRGGTTAAIADAMRMGVKRRTSVSFVPQAMMFFRNGLFYQSYNPNTNTFVKNTPNPAKHIVFTSLQTSNDRLGTEVSATAVDQKYSPAQAITMAILLLEFACGSDHAVVLRGSSKIMVKPEPSLKVIASAARKIFVQTFSFQDGYESFVSMQTKFIVTFGSHAGGAANSDRVTFNWYVTPEQKEEYHGLPQALREKARVLLPRAAMLPKIMDGSGRTHFSNLWTPDTIGKNINEIYKGVGLLNFSFFIHKQEVNMRATIGPIICAPMQKLPPRTVEGVDSLDLPLPPSITEKIYSREEQHEEDYPQAAAAKKIRLDEEVFAMPEECDAENIIKIIDNATAAAAAAETPQDPQVKDQESEQRKEEGGVNAPP